MCMTKRGWVLVGLLILNLGVAADHGSARRTQSRSQSKAQQVQEAPADVKIPWYKRIFGGGRRNKDSGNTRNGSQYPGSTASVGKNSNINGRHFIDAAYLDSVFKGKLKGKGHTIIQTAIRYGFDPVFFAAIMAHETGWGTSKAIRNYNNPGGMMTGGKQAKKYRYFNTIEEGIEKMAANLKAGYLDQGRITIATVASKYAPVPKKGRVANDPKGKNKLWPGNVAAIMNKLINGSVNMSRRSQQITGKANGNKYL